MDEKDIIDEKFYTRTCRLLAMNKKKNYLNVTWKKENIRNNGKYEKKHISNSESVTKGKNKLRKKCTSNNSGGCKQARESKSSV
ncbi:hypothetical protein PMALA_045110 [Plasmodium malariae]|uniref:Uncharacterized protein n=1 Tax=Plasmodium malariae TaxID=5858 RepID=A0A1A8WPQ0_PLAMA|nr:hypothetical protein PMALA_045110 [Plasmodium malariae]